MSLLVCDIAGTTVDDGGVVYRELRSAVEARGVTPTAAQLSAVKGTEKRSAVATLLTTGGRTTDDDEVAATFTAFLDALRRAYSAHPPRPLPGVADALTTLRDRGVSLALTTGFQRSIAEIVLGACGWGTRALSTSPGEPTPASSPLVEGNDAHRLVVDALVTSDTVPAGRPAPHLIHRAMELTGTGSVADVVSAGDTVADLRAAANAGVAGVGVLTGGVDRAVLAAEPHAVILGSLADVTRPEIVRALGLPEA
ncbi:HAD family hydrolase [Corynebacterium bovis]|uniref:Phosphatase n=1 Tax=Corynebacterium bovis TaxID=36808 RepID=A0A3R8R4P4_9CORY|nr:HAD family hydrolase [Corynebacterium bovis]RRO92504.1 phosphatase [Corynebacterium bovis]RRO97911.1 phosphatase [Corynebacterium bovis]RRO99444.1 phosphatase [Corynebacterium bovis]RRQ00305.1 phosphatase [Corynebacterium bovis]RRQ00382.1 phosphatase [Corynebacterium bovis]